MDYEGGWYHVINRGIERRPVFLDDDDRRRFLSLLSELEVNFGVEVHGYCLMDNHFHLVLHTPRANLSRAMRWLGQSYTQGFNRRHDRVGPLFQGRFKSVPVDPEGWVVELSVYVHLNPLRITRLGLGKLENKRESEGLGAKPDTKMVDRRLQELRRYPWSSYRYFAGYYKSVDWLRMDVILGSFGKTAKERHQGYRRLVKERLKRGAEESELEHLREEIALGSAEFVEELKQRFERGMSRETSGKRKMVQPLELETIISCVEELKGAERGEWLKRHGDDGKWMVLHVARHRTGLTLRELGEAMGGMDYVAVSMGIRRFDKKLQENKALKKRFGRVVKKLHVKM